MPVSFVRYELSDASETARTRQITDESRKPSEAMRRRARDETPKDDREGIYDMIADAPKEEE